MSLNYNKTIGLPIISIKNGKKLCKIKDFIIDYQTGKFLGILCLQQKFIFNFKFFIRTEKIKNFGENAIMVENETVLENLYKNKKIADLIKKKIKIKNNKVITEFGYNLGKVKNYEIELTSQKLSKIIVLKEIFNNFLKREIIIPREQIISIGKDAIVVKDTIIKITENLPTKINPKKELSTVTM